MKKSQIPLAKPIIGRDVRRAVSKVLKSGNLTQGQEVEAFEREFSQLVEERECVAVNSGTSALHIALLSLGIGSGDEVIIPSFTFAATANAVALTGAIPIFVDIDISTYNLDPSLIQNAITTRTKAIQVVHLYGLPANMPKIVEIAKRYNILIIEDAAQAHNASINGKPVGTFGAAAAFSFYPTKNMTSGEGGMIVFKEKNDARMARLYRNQGMEQRYQNEIVGFNLRMTDIHGSIGRVQLKHLLKWNKVRQENAMILSNKLQNIIKPFIPTGYSHVFHQYTIRIPKNRNSFSDKLRKKGIETSVYYPTQVHKLPSFDSSLELPQTRLATETVLSLPVHPSLSKWELNKIANAVNELTEDFDA
jgi:dTDP-4-amino-4,6-dideoxygalactose transaminase